MFNEEVHGALQEYFNGFQKRFTDVLRKFKESLQKVSRVFHNLLQGSFQGVSVVCCRCFMDVSWVFQGCFKTGDPENEC